MKMPRLNSLPVQTLLLLSLALFPLGAVAIYQTNLVAAEAEASAERSLLAVTGRAAKTEELIIERAFGVAQFFGAVAGDFIDSPEICESRLGEFVTQNPDYSFIGILPPDGRMTCSSTGETFDFSDWPDFTETMAKQQRTIVVNRQAPLSGTSVFVISEPFEIDGEFAGFISVSIPHEAMIADAEELSGLGLEELITFNASGDILMARTSLDDAVKELPSDRSLAALVGLATTTFATKNQEGMPRTYTVVPIEGSPATVMAVWRVSDGLAGRVGAYLQPAVFPVLMWFASMSVAMLSIYTLVLRHISRLRKNMDVFAHDRHVARLPEGGAIPDEFRALNANFARMADDIIQDEAVLEDALREKNVLIKEVHHRVKNNLQLISSIMNMQIREAKEEETKTVLSRLQDRIISLATIHRDLYQSQNAGRVDAGALVSDIVTKTVEIAAPSGDAFDVSTDIDAVLLYPDQAVPLSLLVAEGLTNAMKYLGAPDGVTPWLNVAFKQEDAQCRFMLANSIGAADDTESTGLGAHLISAFGIQLGGKIEVDHTDDSYTMTVIFDVEDFVPDTPDY